MKDKSAFHDEARRYYEACFGPDSDTAKRYQKLFDAEEAGDWDTVDELREEECDDVLSVEQLTHSFRGNCTLEVLISTGGPAARVIVEVNDDGEFQWADFQYQDWYQPWYSPQGQDHRMLADWAGANFLMECLYCAEERGR